MITRTPPSVRPVSRRPLPAAARVAAAAPKAVAPRRPVQAQAKPASWTWLHKTGYVAGVAAGTAVAGVGMANAAYFLSGQMPIASALLGYAGGGLAALTAAGFGIWGYRKLFPAKPSQPKPAPQPAPAGDHRMGNALLAAGALAVSLFYFTPWARGAGPAATRYLIASVMSLLSGTILAVRLLALRKD